MDESPERGEWRLGRIRHQHEGRASPRRRVELPYERLDGLDAVGHVRREHQLGGLHGGIFPARGHDANVPDAVLGDLLLQHRAHRRRRLDRDELMTAPRQRNGDPPATRAHVDHPILGTDQRGQRVRRRVRFGRHAEVPCQRLPEVRRRVGRRADMLGLHHLGPHHPVVPRHGGLRRRRPVEPRLPVVTCSTHRPAEACRTARVSGERRRPGTTRPRSTRSAPRNVASE